MEISKDMKHSRKSFEEIIKSNFVDKYEPSHQLGPDYINPSTSYWTSEIDKSVQLLFSGEEDEEIPISVVTFFEKTVKNHPNKIGLSVKQHDQWINWTYKEYWNEVFTIAKGFLKLGLDRFGVVANLGFNSPEWCISYLATMMAGGVTTGIYTTNFPSACEYILNHSKSNIVVVENETQLQKILQIKENLPHLKAIVQYIGTPMHEDIFSWDDVKKIGETVPDEVLQKRIKSLSVNECFSLVYTSGTTGNPKAVMLSHDNYIQFCSYLRDFLDFENVNSGEVYCSIVSFLPLNHIAAQVMDIYLAIMHGGRTYFAQPDALKGSLIYTLQEVQPTFFTSVPRVYEKMKEKFEEKLSNMNFIRRVLISWAMQCGLKHTTSTLTGTPLMSCGYSIASRIIQKIKKEMGLSNSLFIIIGGAPVNEEIVDFFFQIEVVLQECYGMSETTGAVCINMRKAYKKLSTGKKTKITDIKIDNPDSNGKGEILMRGRQIFMGYLDNEQSTKETLDNDRWCHSGDIGKIDEEGNLFITGRIKEIIITSGGENIAPYPIEEMVKHELPIVSQAVAIGEKRKFLTMLLTLKTNINLETMTPLDTLSDIGLDWCKQIGSKAETIEDVLDGPDPKIMEEIQKGINRANEKAISNACKVQKWRILSKDFTVQDNELSQTMKLKRFQIQRKYESIIDEMYN